MKEQAITKSPKLTAMILLNTWMGYHFRTAGTAK